MDHAAVLLRQSEFVDWIGRSLGSILLLIAGIVALYLVPGLAVLRFLWRGRPLIFTERLALALGIGIALPPLALELAHLIRLPWGSATTYCYIG